METYLVHHDVWVLRLMPNYWGFQKIWSWKKSHNKLILENLVSEKNLVSEYLASKKDDTEWQETDKNKIRGKRIIVCEHSNYCDAYRTWVWSLPGLVYNSLIHSCYWNLIDVTRADDHACLVLKLVAKNREKLSNKLRRIGKNSLVCIP